MKRAEAEALVWAEMSTCLKLVTEMRGHRPNNDTLDRTVRSVVQRLINEGVLHLDQGP